MRFFNKLPLQRNSKLTDPNKMAQQLSTLLSGGTSSGGTSGSGILTYNTLSDLQNAYPSGTNQLVWVISDNAWYYWNGSTTATAPTDVTGLAANSITQTSLILSWTGSTGATSYDVYNGSTLLGNTTSTSYNVSNLSASTAYTFKIIAKNSGGSSAGVTVNATTLAVATPPADVTNLATSNVSNSSVTLTWTASASATSYDVYNGATLLGNTTALTYQATSLSSSTLYTFKIVAKNAAGSSSGATLNVTTLATAPNPVTALTVGTIQPSTVAISWTAPSGGSAVDHYEVAYEASGASSYTVASNAVNSSSTSYTVTGLHQLTSYTIRVVAIDASGNRSQATTVSATTIALTASASPTAGTYTSAQTVTLSSNGVAGTNIYYTTDGSTPTTSSTLYSSAITVSTTETIKFFAQNPVGDSSAVQTAIYTISAAPTNTVLVSDDFNRANGSALGSTDSYNGGTSKAWSIDAGIGQWGISNNKTYSIATGTGKAYLDAGASDISVQVDLTWQSNAGIMTRFTDVNNYIFGRITSSGAQIYKVVAGTATQIGTTYSFAPVAGTTYTLKLTASGSNLTLYMNGTSVVTGSDTFNQTATKCGLRTSNDTTSTYDNFIVTNP